MALAIKPGTQETEHDSRWLESECGSRTVTLRPSRASARAAEKDTKTPEIPTCDKKIGTLAVEGAGEQLVAAYNLESPEALIKVFVSQSKCFTLVDRGKGLAAAQRSARWPAAARCAAAPTSARAR